MDRVLFGGCGNAGCLDCEPYFVIESDSAESIYQVSLQIEEL